MKERYVGLNQKYEKEVINMTDIKFQKVQMTPEELVEKKLHLKFCKLSRDESDLTLTELEASLGTGLATKLLDDDIARINKDLEAGIIKDPWGNDVDSTEADKIKMKITVDKFKQQKELDIPTRQLRLKIEQLREAKSRPDAPEKQIKVLEKEIREKAFEHIAKETPTSIN